MLGLRPVGSVRSGLQLAGLSLRGIDELGEVAAFIDAFTGRIRDTVGAGTPNSEAICSRPTRDGMTLSHEDDGTTILRGTVTDQAELRHLLAKVRDCGVTLISVTSTNAGHDADPQRPRDR